MFSYCTVQINSCSQFYKAFNVYHPVQVIVLPLDEPSVCVICIVNWFDFFFLYKCDYHCWMLVEFCFIILKNNSVKSSCIFLSTERKKKKVCCQMSLSVMLYESSTKISLLQCHFLAMSFKGIVHPKMKMCWKLPIRSSKMEMSLFLHQSKFGEI